MLRIACTLLVALLAVSAHAQTYPSKPVRIIVPFAQGGAADLLSRMVGQRLQEIGGTPAHLAAVIREESALYADLFKRTGIRAE